jgi:hypothetical protein
MGFQAFGAMALALFIAVARAGFQTPMDSPRLPQDQETRFSLTG